MSEHTPRLRRVEYSYGHVIQRDAEGWRMHEPSWIKHGGGGSWFTYGGTFDTLEEAEAALAKVTPLIEKAWELGFELSRTRQAYYAEAMKLAPRRKSPKTEVSHA